MVSGTLFSYNLHSERKTAKANGEAVRYNHKGTNYVTISPISTKPYKNEK